MPGLGLGRREHRHLWHKLKAKRSRQCYQAEDHGTARAVGKPCLGRQRDGKRCKRRGQPAAGSDQQRDLRGGQHKCCDHDRADTAAAGHGKRPKARYEKGCENQSEGCRDADTGRQQYPCRGGEQKRARDQHPDKPALLVTHRTLCNARLYQPVAAGGNGPHQPDISGRNQIQLNASETVRLADRFCLGRDLTRHSHSSL